MNKMSRSDPSQSLEVKSGRKFRISPGIEEFTKKYHPHKKYLIGKGGLELDDFFKINPADLF